jgi:hypothetical protein
MEKKKRVSFEKKLIEVLKYFTLISNEENTAYKVSRKREVPFHYLSISLKHSDLNFLITCAYLEIKDLI